MNANETLEPATEEVGQEMCMVRRHAENGIQAAKEPVQKASTTTGETASIAMQRGKEIMAETYDAASAGLDAVVKAAQIRVQQNPWIAVFGTLGVGFSLGFLSGLTFQKRPAQHDPVSVLRDALRSMVASR